MKAAKEETKNPKNLKGNPEKTKEKRFEEEENKCIYIYMADLNKELMKACEVGNLKGAEDAIEKGADVNYKDRDNYKNTPLDITSYKGNIELAKMLIQKGADVNSKNSWGLTALHIASMDGNIELADLLIENGADVNIKDDFGKTPLTTALNKGDDEEVVNLLLTKGAATVDKNDIKTARRQGRTDMVNLLEKWNFPRSMTVASLNGLNVLSGIDPESLKKDLLEFKGNSVNGEIIGYEAGRRRNKKSKKLNIKKSINNKKKSRKNKRKTIGKRRK